jgi:ribose 5-phosphate isomerase B
MKIAVGSDHAGYHVKQVLVRRLSEAGHEVKDCGCHDAESCDYPDFAHAVAQRVSAGEAVRGILVCGTGLGVCMAANKHVGVRAATVHDRFTAQMSREHNDANVICLGARVLEEKLAVELTEYWLTVPFAGGRHERRVGKIEADKLAQA